MDKKRAQKAVKKAQKALDKSVANRYKTRGGLLPSQIHGSENPVRSNKVVPVISRSNKVSLEDYEDFE